MRWSAIGEGDLVPEGWIRTTDLFITSEALFHLSYTGLET